MGDPAGIGLDITLAAWAGRQRRMLPAFALYADPVVIADRARMLELDVPLRIFDDPVLARAAFTDALPVLPVPLPEKVTPGQPGAANASAVIASIERAVADTIQGRCAAIITNPIAKSVLYGAGFSHPGHTEFLAALAERLTGVPAVRPVMMLAAAELRVVPLTIHIPLKDVPARITRDLILDTARITERALKADLGIPRPRLAFAGLNPHAGEGGSMGREEIDVIAPAIEILREEGFDVSGPYPADTMFHEAARTGYDAAIAMYHDQALIPLKTLAFDRGVNITLGLPFVRTSPDHGTAFPLAGSGKASAESFIQALLAAAVMAASRVEHRS